MKLKPISRDDLIALIGPKDVVFDFINDDIDYKLRSGRIIAKKINNEYFEVVQ